MKIKSVVLVLITFLCVIGVLDACKKKTEEEPQEKYKPQLTDWEKDYLKGSVKKVVDDEDGGTTSEYNNLGFKTKYIYRDGAVDIVTDYEYNADNLILKKVSYANPSTTKTTIYTYDDLNRLVSAKVDDNNNETIAYSSDTEGTKIVKELGKEVGKIIITLNKKSVIIKQEGNYTAYENGTENKDKSYSFTETYNDFGQLLSVNKKYVSGTETQKTYTEVKETYTYSGKVITQYVGPGGGYGRGIIIDYNDGLKIKKTDVKSDVVGDITNYEYTFDNQNNWIKIRYHYSTGSSSSYDRTVEYY